jgi:opacity protein-like surface antigen
MVQRGNWVFGGELSLSSGFDTDIKRDVDLYFGSGVGAMSARMSYLVMSSTRVGYSWGNVLSYAKVGTAGAVIKLETDDNVPTDWTSRSRHFYTGWVFGAGVDYQIMPNLLLGIEYNYVTLDGKAWTQISNGDNFRSRIDLDSHSVLARLSYKMDAPALATLMPF